MYAIPMICAEIADESEGMSLRFYQSLSYEHRCSISESFDFRTKAKSRLHALNDIMCSQIISTYFTQSTILCYNDFIPLSALTSIDIVFSIFQGIRELRYQFFMFQQRKKSVFFTTKSKTWKIIQYKKIGFLRMCAITNDRTDCHCLHLLYRIRVSI